jgi:cytosine/adenosine deaminase-related metal-dependent hydrolase
MSLYRAAWVLPIGASPIRDGWIATEHGRIVACGALAARAAALSESREVDLGQVAVLPGLVNAHTHLELSHLGGKIPPASRFVAWIRAVMAARRQWPDPRAPEIVESMAGAIAESVDSGTAVLGDISNTLASYDVLARSRLAAVVFYELIGFNTADPIAFVARACREIDALRPSGAAEAASSEPETADRVRTSLAAHAPCSVAPPVFREIRRAIERHRSAPCSVHLSESAEEVEFIRTARGPWRQLLDDAGAWAPGWTAPGVSPVQFLDDNGFLDARVLAVHGVQMTRAELALLASRGATLVTCPRSNRYTGAGTPPIEAFYGSGARVAVGTDSLASAPDLNVFSELAAMRALAPAIPASMLLASATIEGARALGFGADYGTIEPGKVARLLAVDIPAGSGDVEEYLVSGIRPEQLRWIE